MKIVAFGASYSKHSINKTFANYASSQFQDAEVDLLDLNDYSLPLFTVDVEKETGHPAIIQQFLNKLSTADLIIISLAEHNGSYTAAFKNLFDWTSRVQVKMFDNKKLLLLSTAPGPRGGLSVMEAAKNRFPIHGANIIGHFSLPKFKENFSEENGILDAALKEAFDIVINNVKDIYADVKS